MNTKMISCLVVLLVFNNVSFAMHGKVLRAVQIITNGSLIGLGSYVCYQKRKSLNNDVDYDPVSPRVKEWAVKEMKKLNVPNSGAVPILRRWDGDNWGVCNDKMILCPIKDVVRLDDALLAEKDCEQEYGKVLALRNAWLEHNEAVKVRQNSLVRQLSGQKLKCYTAQDFHKLDVFAHILQEGIVKHKRTIALNTIVLKHELKHYISKDAEKSAYAYVFIPIGVQVGCSFVTCGVNKLLKVQLPKTWMRTILRSGASIVSIVPKVVLNATGLVWYARYQEQEADRFACEHAESHMELEEFYKDYKLHADDFEKSIIMQTPSIISLNQKDKEQVMRLLHVFYDYEHPYPGDRAAMVQGYIDKWDAEHKA